MKSQRWLTNKEAAEYLGCSETFLNRDRSERLHGIPFSRLGRHCRYDVGELDRWLESNKVSGRTGDQS
jgi:excisionase family DNA binding protein